MCTFHFLCFKIILHVHCIRIYKYMSSTKMVFDYLIQSENIYRYRLSSSHVSFPQAAVVTSCRKRMNSTFTFPPWGAVNYIKIILHRNSLIIYIQDYNSKVTGAQDSLTLSTMTGSKFKNMMNNIRFAFIQTISMRNP